MPTGEAIAVTEIGMRGVGVSVVLATPAAEVDVFGAISPVSHVHRARRKVCRAGRQVGYVSNLNSINTSVNVAC